ncbi:MAG: hypothetical protein ACK5UG_13750 [Synechococcaceae cyanobacterium]|jgi:hypothetical protein
MTTATTTTTIPQGKALQRGLLLTASLLLLGQPQARALPVGGELAPLDLQRLGPVQQRNYFLSLRRLEDQRHERQLDLQARSEWCHRSAGMSLGAIRRCWASDERAAAELASAMLEERRQLDRRFGLLARGPAGAGVWAVAAADAYAPPPAYGPPAHGLPAYGNGGGWQGWPRGAWR